MAAAAGTLEVVVEEVLHQMDNHPTPVLLVVEVHPQVGEEVGEVLEELLVLLYRVVTEEEE